ncbi:MAG: branched-chain amino acid ABC transporter permease [Protaetiibacter sp.]
MAHDRTASSPRLSRALVAALVFVATLFALFAAAAPAQADPIDPSAADETIKVWVRNNADKAGVAGIGVTVEGDGFSEAFTTGDDGIVLVGLPDAGTYTVTIDESTIPEGMGRPNALSREVDVFAGNKNQPAIFLIDPSFTPGESTDDATTSPTDTATDSTSSDASTGSSQDIGALVIQKIVTGLIFGLLLALAAIGLSLIYGTTGLNNFAHGELVTFGGLMAFTFGNLLGLPALLAIPVAVVLGGLFGWTQDTVIWRPLRKRNLKLIPLMIVTIGLSLVLRYLFAFIWGADRMTLANDPKPFLVLGPVSLRFTDVFGAGLAIVMLLLVAFVLLRTKIGKAMRAVSDNRALAAASGINVERVIRVVWVGGGALAALAGVYVAYYQGLRWDTGAAILLLIFAAVTLGGLGTAFGALVGSIVLSVFMNVSTLWIPENLKIVGALVVMILILLFRPQGILGRRERIG